MRELLNYLQHNIGKVKERFPHINYGGCGEFAVLLFMKFVELGIEPECIILGRPIAGYPFSPQGLERKINECNTLSELNCYLDLHHIILKVDNCYIDAEQVTTSYINFNYYNVQKYHIDIEALIRINANPKGWNYRYDREHTSKIKKLLDKIFEPIMVEHNPDAQNPISIMIGAMGKGKTAFVKPL